MRIRFCKKEDIPEIFIIYNSLFRQSDDLSINKSVIHFYDQFYTFPQGILVGEMDGKIIGYSMTWFIKTRWDETDLSFLNSNILVSKYHDPNGITAFGSSLAVLEDYRKYNFAHELFKQIVLFVGNNYPNIKYTLALCEDDNRSRKLHYRLGYEPVYVINDMFIYNKEKRNGILMEIEYNKLRESFTNGISNKWFGASKISNIESEIK